MKFLMATVLLLPLSAEESDPVAPTQDDPTSRWEYLAQKYDANKDGQITAKEYGRDAETFSRLDADKSGAIEEVELASGGRRGGRRGGSGERGERGGQRGERGGRDPRASLVAPKAGELAPGFALEEMIAFGDQLTKLPQGKPVKLESFRGKRPVALIFGSYT